MIMTDCSYRFNSEESIFSFKVKIIKNGCVENTTYEFPLKTIDRDLIELCYGLIRKEVNLYLTLAYDEFAELQKVDIFDVGNNMLIFSIQLKE